MEDRHPLDPLTNLPSRAALIDRMNRAMRQVKKDRGYRFALLRLEIGCPASGDAESSSDEAKAFLLSTVARRLQTTLQAVAAAAKSKAAGFVARLEGEQFAILLDDLRDLRDSRTSASASSRPSSRPSRWVGRRCSSPPALASP